MPSFTLSRPDLYPSGTTVNAYPASNWSQAALPPSGAPVGSSSGSAVATATGVTFTTLLEDTAYYAYALVSGVHQYVRFVVDTVRTADQALDRDMGQAGVIAPMHGGLLYGAALALTASRASVARFVPSRDMLISKIAFVTTTAAGTDDAVDVGIYDSNFARLVSKGATTGILNTTAGVKVIDITPTQLKAGIVYFAALSVGTFGGAAVAMHVTNAASNNVGDIFGTGSARMVGFQNTAHPLPTTITVAGGIASVPYLALRES